MVVGLSEDGIRVVVLGLTEEVICGSEEVVLWTGL